MPNLRHLLCRHDWKDRRQSTYASAYRDGAWQTHDGARASCPVVSEYYFWRECEKCGAVRDGDMKHTPAIIVTDVFTNKPPGRSHS